MLGTLILIGTFIFQAQQFKSNLLSESEDESNESTDNIETPTISDSSWKRMKLSIDAALQQVSSNTLSTENEQNLGTALHNMVARHHSTLLERGFLLLKDAIEQDSAKTLLINGDKGPLYLIALPFQGDRPNLLRQTEGFSQGLARHIEQIYLQLRSLGKAEIPLVFVAFFYKISEQKGVIYAGCHDSTVRLLPRSLLSNGEISLYPNSLSNYRQTIDNIFHETHS